MKIHVAISTKKTAGKLSGKPVKPAVKPTGKSVLLTRAVKAKR